ncbi:MAG: MiaB/RimO family radical SAM methylthiotransferase [Actinobacteria bacterium]|nr:MiaB/RimO family radical SAM methylthiotransferase [Actinomycetota bacterium]
MKNIYTENNYNKFSIYTLGCKTNQSESDFITRALTEKGFRLVDTPAADFSDFIIINTCTVTSAADKKVRQLIRRIRNGSPNAKLLVTGCYAVFNKKFLINNDVDFVVSNKEKFKIQDLIFKIAKVEKKSFNISQEGEIIPEIPQKYLNGGLNNKEKCKSESQHDYFFHSRALLKIQDGCEQECSYCIVPLVRGPYISAHSEKIINEIKSLVGMGHEEIVITGIHIGKYGIDFNKSINNFQKSPNRKGKSKGRNLNKPDAEVDNLTALLAEILNRTSLKRIRLSSVEINEIDKDLINLISISRGRIARHLHIPLQSGSSRILKLMNRNYTREYFLNVIKDIKDLIPEVTFTTDIIVGFPGETESDFLDTVDIVNEVKFSKIHVFKYSKRSGTEAALLGNQVSEIEKSERSSRLRKLADQLRIKFILKNIHHCLDVVCEEIVNGNKKIKNNDKDTRTICGTSENYIKVYFEASSGDFKRLRGKIVKVMIESQYRAGLSGKLY